jgi:hypothetical protein
VARAPDLETAAGLTALLAGVLRATVAGTLPVSTAHAAAQLGGAVRQLIETSDLEARLAALEARQDAAPRLRRTG